MHIKTVMNTKNIITWLFFRIKYMRTDIMAAKIWINDIFCVLIDQKNKNSVSSA